MSYCSGSACCWMCGEGCAAWLELPEPARGGGGGGGARPSALEPGECGACCACARRRERMKTRTCACVRVHTQTHTHKHSHTHSHTHTHTHTHRRLRARHRASRAGGPPLGQVPRGPGRGHVAAVQRVPREEGERGAAHSRPSATHIRGCVVACIRLYVGTHP